MHAPLWGAAPLRGGSKSSKGTLLVSDLLEGTVRDSIRALLSLRVEMRTCPAAGGRRSSPSDMFCCFYKTDATGFRRPSRLISRDAARVLRPGVPGSRRFLRRAVGYKAAVTTAI